jgi:hypothetical protein
VPELSYGALEDVRDGADAQAAYLEAIASGAAETRRAVLREALQRYCRLDTEAMRRLTAVLQARARHARG